jgi:Ribbon-helix-helix protein, copG family
MYRMSLHTKTARVDARVPAELADAVEERADALGVPTSHVVREALAREMLTPVDKRAASYVAQWLARPDRPRSAANRKVGG